jgi:hypothetical protein
MPGKRATKKTTTRKSAAKPTPVNKTVPLPKAASEVANERPASTAIDVCPRCGTTKFGLEERTRVDGRRTVRYTVLVCERGHTFAKPIRR